MAPTTRRGSAPPPLLFQVDTVDPWVGSHPGHEPHSAPRHEIDEAFERALGPSFEPTAAPVHGRLGRRRAHVPDESQAPDQAPAPEAPLHPPIVVAPPVPGADDVSQAATTGVIAPIQPDYLPPAPITPVAYSAPVAPAPVLPGPIAEAPSLAPPILEPPVYVPPSSGPSAFIGQPTDDPLFDQTVYDDPAAPEVPAPSEPSVLPEPTFWSPPTPRVDQAPPAAIAPDYSLAPPGGLADPTPLFFTKDGAPPAPVSLSKATAPTADPWLAALQPEAPPFHLEPPALYLEPPAPQGPSWFDGHLDPFDFAGQFGTPDPSWAPAAAGGPGVGLADAESDGADGGGRHRVDGAADGSSRRSRRAKKPPRKAPWWELPALVALAIVIAVVVKTFVVQPFYIPSPSMEKTLHGCTGCSGDRILVNKPIYDLRDPHPGDIVVFNAPPGWNDEPGTKPPSNPILRAGRGFLQLIGFVPPDGLVLVKRVIAVGGQTVKGVAVNGGKSEQIMISDHGDAGPWRTLVEPYVYIDPGQTDINANFGPVKVPAHRLWVMGDHRNDSADSRYHCGPNEGGLASQGVCDPMTSTVPVSDVIGKAVLIAWPPSRWRTLGTPGTFAGGVVLPLFFLRRRRRRRRPRHAA